MIGCLGVGLAVPCRLTGISGSCVTPTDHEYYNNRRHDQGGAVPPDPPRQALRRGVAVRRDQLAGLEAAELAGAVVVTPRLFAEFVRAKRARAEVAHPCKNEEEVR